MGSNEARARSLSWDGVKSDFLDCIVRLRTCAIHGSLTHTCMEALQAGIPTPGMVHAWMLQASCDEPQNQAGRDAHRIIAFPRQVVQAPQALGQLVVWRAPPSSRWGTRARMDNTPQAVHSSTRRGPGVGQ